MTEVDAPCAQAEKTLPPSQNDLNSVGSAVSHLSIDTNMSLREVIESSVGSPGVSSDYAALSPSDIALLDCPDPKSSDSLLKIPKVEENSFSPDPLAMDAETFPSLPCPADPVLTQVMISGIDNQRSPKGDNFMVHKPVEGKESYC